MAYEPSSLNLDSTFAYYGLNEFATDFPYVMDKIYLVPWVTDEYEQVSTPVGMYLSNFVSTLYTCDRDYSHDMGMLYTENALCEVWMNMSAGALEPTTAKRSSFLDCPYVDWMEQGKGFVFSCIDEEGDERGKLFSLSMFYMVNHQLGFYYYRTHSHDTAEGEHIEDWQWNPWVEFDVGQPAVNSLGLQDFQGNSGTDRYFVYDTQTNFDILGREFERTDGTRILILVKLMKPGQTGGSNPVNVTLPDTYQRVASPDGGPGSLATPSTQVSMANNAGVILIEYEESGGGSGGGKVNPGS